MRGINFLSGCGIAAALLIGAYGIGAAVPIGGPPSGGEHQPAQTEQPAPEPLPPIVAEEEQPSTAIQAEPCDNPDTREESDLCQQWRMAQASEDLVRLTDRQNTLTMIEAGLLAATIVFTAIAAWAAVVAARAAIRSVKVMRDAERPYVTLSNPRMKYFGPIWKQTYPDGRPVELWSEFGNIGKGVAFIEVFGLAIEICDEGKQGGVAPHLHGDFGRMPIRPDGDVSFDEASAVIEIKPNQSAKIMDNTKTLYAYGFTRYSDMSGTLWETGFIFELIPDADSYDGGVFVVCHNRRFWYDKEIKADAD